MYFFAPCFSGSGSGRGGLDQQDTGQDDGRGQGHDEGYDTVSP